MTNKLEHYVPESGRALRTLHMERRKTQKNEMKNARWRCGGGGRARRIKSYCVEHTSAEMTTVLRNQTLIRIRLREKLELQLCTVFHSTRNSIILTRNAYRLRILQEHDEKPLLSLFLHAKQK